MTRRIAPGVFALTLAAPAAAPLAAQPVVKVDFSEYQSTTTRDIPATFGQPLTSRGFDFYEAFGTDGRGTGSRNALGTWGTADGGSVNRPSNLGSANTLYATTGAVEIDMYVAGDNPFSPTRSFNLFSMDVANLFSSSVLPPSTGGPLGFTLTFYGYTAADPVGFTQTFTIPTPPTVGGVVTPVLNTLVFDTRWRGVENVYWYQNSQFLNYQHQFTNVVAQVTPEPSTYVLLGAGLAGVLVVARRRRTV